MFVVMHIVRNKSKHGKAKKIYQSTLLMESYREDGKVKKRTIANLSHCNDSEIKALELALKYKGNLGSLKTVKDVILEEGQSIGATWLGYQMAKNIGIESALGTGREGKLALWQVLSRMIDQGSRLSAVRLAQNHAACDILRIKKGFNEEDLYKNLTWLSENQEKIEKNLYRARKGGKEPELFLYDVTSSYLEGTENAYSNYGYNRDRKRGKQQIVIGLLCDEEGVPVAVEVFEGNTNDTKTVQSQIQKIARRFKCKQVIMVGDRGMLKRTQIEALPDNFKFITAITKPQIESLIKSGDIQLELFEDQVSEIQSGKYRYVLKRNPIRAQEMAECRAAKFNALIEYVNKQTQYLIDHPRAKIQTAQKLIEAKINQLCIKKWCHLQEENRCFSIIEDKCKRKEILQLDGCYVLKTDITNVSAEVIHSRYKDLALVEQAFRTMKTVVLEARPVYVRTAANTRGHVLVVMLAYLLAWKLRKHWNNLDCTVAEGLQQLSTLCSIKISFKNSEASCHTIPKPRAFSQKLLKAVNVILPQGIPIINSIVETRKKLITSRI